MMGISLSTGICIVITLSSVSPFRAFPKICKSEFSACPIKILSMPSLSCIFALEICQAPEPPTIILARYFLSAGLESKSSNSTNVAGFPFMPKILVYVLLTKPIPRGSIVEIPIIFVFGPIKRWRLVGHTVTTLPSPNSSISNDSTFLKP